MGGKVSTTIRFDYHRQFCLLHKVFGRLVRGTVAAHV